MTIEYHDNMTREGFLLEWIGVIEGRDLGTNKSPRRDWTDSAQEFLNFVKMCCSEHEPEEFTRPCWISVQPMRLVKTEEEFGFIRRLGEACAIEKLFFDFDDDTKYCSTCNQYIKKDKLVKNESKRGSFCPTCGTECFEKIRKEVVAVEVSKFLEHSKGIFQKFNFVPIPFIVETRKGYHVYYFLYNIFEFNPSNFAFAKALYEQMQNILIHKEENGKTISLFEFIDEHVIGDLNRLSRVPLTPHEKTGQICQILDENLKPTKVRSLEFYKQYGIQFPFIKESVSEVKRNVYKKLIEEKNQIKQFELHGLKHDTNNGFTKGVIRPCFVVRMEKGEMNHNQRLAWLSEVYHAGHDTPEKILELCRQTFNDYKEDKSRTQIEDFFKHKRWTFKPYKCVTLKRKGWCIGAELCAERREVK